MTAAVFDQFGSRMRFPLLVDRFGTALTDAEADSVTWDDRTKLVIVVHR